MSVVKEVVEFISGVLIHTDHYKSSPGVCEVLSSVCLTICICTFFNLFYLTFNRYIFIWHNKNYDKIFTQNSTLTMCASSWAFAAFCDLPNYFGYGGHFFDSRSYYCIWDKPARASFTKFIIFGLVASPSLALAFCNFRLLWYIIVSRRPGAVVRYVR